MSSLVSLNETIALLVLAVGLAMLLGNAFALIKGDSANVNPDLTLHKGRAWFLMVAGVIITAWAVASLVS